MTIVERIVAGRYRLVGSLGTGGMSRVWLAVDELLHRDVAVKEIVLKAGLTEDEQTGLHIRTISEACAAARVRHPNVVQIHDVMRTYDGIWIVMEYIRGSSLRQLIIDRGPLPPAQVALIGLPMLAALDAAHRTGVLHRDVKPGNVLVAPDGRVVLTDFGLATIGKVESDRDTDAGIVEGAPAYIAPERALDGRSSVEADLWSLGATLYAAVEGRPPYSRTSMTGTLAAVATEPPDPVHLAGPLEPVLKGLLRKDSRKRMGSAEAAWLLRRVAAGDDANVPLLVPPDVPVGDDGNTSPPAPVSPARPRIAAMAAVDTGYGNGAGRESPSGTADRVSPGPAVRPMRRRPLRLIGTGIAIVIVIALAIVVLQRASSADRRTVRFQAAPPTAPMTTPGQAGPTVGPAQPDARTVRFVLPDGWAWHDDPAGFRLAVPQGWSINRTDVGVYFREPAGYRVLAVKQWKPSSPDPVVALTRQEADTRGLANYERIRIEAVPQYFTSCAVWEYRHEADGRQLHTLERAFTTPSGRSFAFSWRGAAFDRLINEANFVLVTASFRAD